MGTALDDIAAERARQISAEGWTPEHDDEHNDASMARAAACYALLSDPLRATPVAHRRVWVPHPGADELSRAQGVYKDVPKYWPWHADWWKPKNQRADLVRAGALIVAEIERLDRTAQQRAVSSQATAAEDL